MPFLLPCSCGQKILIRRSQAGSFAQCTYCSAKLDVPTLAGLAKLEWIDDEPGDPRQMPAARRWNPIRGVIAAVCLLVAIVGLTRSGLYAAFRLANPTNFTVEEMLDAYDEAGKLMTPAETWDSWCYIQERGLTKKNPPPAFVLKRNLEQRDPWMIGWGVAGATGLLGLALTTFIRPSTCK